MLNGNNVLPLRSRKQFVTKPAPEFAAALEKVGRIRHRPINLENPMAQWLKVLRLILVLTALGSVAGHALAQLAPDERRQMRQEMREHWQQLPAEDRQRFRQERQERREVFQQMPPEDRNRLRDELRGQHNGGRGGANFEHRGGGRH